MDNWVFGLEADIQGSGEKGSTNAVCPGGTATTLARRVLPGTHW